MQRGRYIKKKEKKNRIPGPLYFKKRSSEEKRGKKENVFMKDKIMDSSLPPLPLILHKLNNPNSLTTTYHQPNSGQINR